MTASKTGCQSLVTKREEEKNRLQLPKTRSKAVSRRRIPQPLTYPPISSALYITEIERKKPVNESCEYPSDLVFLLPPFFGGDLALPTLFQGVFTVDATKLEVPHTLFIKVFEITRTRFQDVIAMEVEVICLISNITVHM